MRSKLFTASAALALVALSFTTFAQPTLPSSSLSGDDPDGTFSAFGDAFGAGADTWDDWLFVGSPRETTFRNGADFQDGAVYIYKLDAGGTYVFQQKLTSPGDSTFNGIGFAEGDRFGGGIAAENGRLFISAANDQNFPGLVDPRQGIIDPADPPFRFAGQVHVYELDGGSWDHVQTLTSPNPGSTGAYGARSQASHIAVNSLGTVAAIGELDNFDGGVGRLHTYKRKAGSWHYEQTIEAPAGIDTFGDDLVFVSDKYLVAGANDISDDELSQQGYVFVYQSKGKGGQFFADPVQAIAGPSYDFADCGFGGTFGSQGLDAGGGVVAIADPCFVGLAGVFAGAVSVYSLSEPSILTLEQMIEGDASLLFFGTNSFTARHAIAVSDTGSRILIGSPLSPTGFFEAGSIGADVRVYGFDGTAWTAESNLTTSTPASAIFRTYGDTVFFTDDDTAFVREGNFLDPVIGGLKSQGLFYDL